MEKAAFGRGLLGAALLAGCAVDGQAEPMLHPPKERRFDTRIAAEFRHPDEIVERCAERGVRFVRDGERVAGACSDTTLMTLPNPCYVEGGWYAELLCHELGHANGWSASHDGGSYFPSRPIQPASRSPEARGERPGRD